LFVPKKIFRCESFVPIPVPVSYDCPFYNGENVAVLYCTCTDWYSNSVSARTVPVPVRAVTLNLPVRYEYSLSLLSAGNIVMRLYGTCRKRERAYGTRNRRIYSSGSTGTAVLVLPVVATVLYLVPRGI
jgi:hypothetical protein